VSEDAMRAGGTSEKATGEDADGEDVR